MAELPGSAPIAPRISMTCDCAPKLLAMQIPPLARRRFSRSPRQVLPVWLGFVLFIGATVGFLGIAAGVTAAGSPGPLDQAVATWFRAHRASGLTTAMQLATALGSTALVTGVALSVVLVLAWRRRWDALPVFGLAVPGGMVVNVILKTVFHRARSGPEAWSLSFSGYGFPSGHTMAATLLYGALAAWALTALDMRRERIAVVFGAFALVALVGVSRLALGAHYLSDVLGGAAAGLAWLLLCFTTAVALRRRVFTQGHHEH